MEFLIKYFKHMMFGIVILFMGEWVFYMFYISPGLSRKFVSLKGNIETTKQAIGFEKKSRDRQRLAVEKYKVETSKLNMNYLNRYGEKGDYTAYFLKDLSEFADKKRVNIHSIEPLPQEKTKNYIKDSFALTVQADFHFFVNFISYLENSLGLSAGDFKISRNKKKTSIFKFTISAYKILKGELLSQDFKKRKEVSTLTTDPFVDLTTVKKKRKIKIRTGPVKKIEKVENIWEWIDEISFNGILNINGEKTVLIGQRIVKIGDNVRGSRLISIKDNEVTFKMGQQTKSIILTE